MLSTRLHTLTSAVNLANAGVDVPIQAAALDWPVRPLVEVPAAHSVHEVDPAVVLNELAAHAEVSTQRLLLRSDAH
jgi:hypothetical protein